MSEHHPVPDNRRPFAIGVGVALVLMIVAVLVSVDRVAGQHALTAGATPVPSAATPAISTLAATSTATAEATPTSPTSGATALELADCTKQHFGSPLAPSGQPADVHKYAAPPPVQIDAHKLYEATLTTAKGTITLRLQPELAPVAVNNFVVLARNHYYDGLTFHRVVADFVIQAGDPKGDGSGGPGYTFADEPVRHAYTVGAVAMANSGPNTNGSQFFICIGSQCPPLPPKYTLFGQVVTGNDVALKVTQGDTLTTVTVAEQQ